jgi:hypothetical protein
MSKGRARIFEISGEDNRDGNHAGFIKRQDFLPLEDGLSFIRDEIQHSGCEYFEVRIYNNQDAAIRAHNYAKRRETIPCWPV